MNRWWGNLALAAASTLFAALLAEAGLRVWGYTPEHSAKTARIANPQHTLMLDCYPDDPRGDFDVDLQDPATLVEYRQAGVQRLAAVAARAPQCVEYRYNSSHFRDRELGARRSGVKRIVVLGDSFTEGQGVRESDTSPRRLESLLRLSGAEVEVLNCGQRATDFPRLMEVFDRALALSPDLLLYAMVLNDGERSPEFEARQSYLNDWITDQARMARGDLPGGLRLLALLRDRWEAFRVGRESTRWYLDMYGEPNQAGWLATQDHLREMDRRVREQGGRFGVALWPLLVGLDGSYPFESVHQRLGAFFQHAAIPQLDLLDTFRGSASDRLWVHAVDHHPNLEAHRRAAEALAPVVSSWLRSGSSDEKR